MSELPRNDQLQTGKTAVLKLREIFYFVFTLKQIGYSVRRVFIFLRWTVKDKIGVHKKKFQRIS
jgi:hypothetical protein